MLASVDLGLNGRTAVVTGGSRGIGAAVVQRLREEGARAIAVARSADAGNQDAVAADVTDPGAVDAICSAIAPRVAPDILVNAAGTAYLRSLEELTDDEWRRLNELHVIAPMRLMRAFAPEMARAGWGRIVNVSSSAGKRPTITNPAYSVTKAAALSLSRVFAEASTRATECWSMRSRPARPRASCGPRPVASPTRSPPSAQEPHASRSSKSAAPSCRSDGCQSPPRSPR